MMAFALVAQPDLVQCAHCPAMVQDVAEGVPEGWDAVFARGEWSFTCADCLSSLAGDPVFAVFRPVAKEIGLFVGSAMGFRHVPLTLADATRLHRTLGQALALAANPGGLA